MKIVNECIQKHLGELVSHPLFTEMKPNPDLSRALAFAEVLAPWVMTFQDITRINASLAKDPEIRATLATHAREDRGHQEWFLDDLDLIFGERVRDVRWLYDPALDVVREESLAIASEIFRVDDDRLRIVFVEALEAAAGAFIARVCRQAAESGDDGKLKYFGPVHAEAESGHEMFEDEERDEEVLPDDVRERALPMVGRIFGSFLRMADVAFAKQSAANA
ncbi:MAG: hypothetical protein GXY23_10730 [Myxococcales bacterium]|jgi:hypothetical protein|nr:hypothetical protein [Myxococcales bacterium]